MRSNFTLNSRLYRLCLAFACRDEHYLFRSHYRADAHCYGIVRHGNISKILRICSYRAIGKLYFECLVSELISRLIESDVAVSADSEKLDIYSTGVMLYEMLTGRLPFEADSAVSVAIMQLQSEPKLPREINPSIPEGLEEITIKAMQKDPAKRYQSAAEMLYDIDEFKRNPSIHFEYKYFVDETPTRFVEAITKVKGETALEETPEEADELAEEGAEEEKKGPPVLPILAAIAGAFVVVGLIFVAIIFIFGLVDPGKENIEVENFVGKTLEEVTNNEEYAKLYKFNPPEQEYSNEYDKGVICKQNPKPGTSKKIKVEITLTVSMGKRTVQIPEVQENEHKDVVVSRITAAGFVPQLTQMTSDTVAKTSSSARWEFCPSR